MGGGYGTGPRRHSAGSDQHLPHGDGVPRSLGGTGAAPGCRAAVNSRLKATQFRIHRHERSRCPRHTPAGPTPAITTACSAPSVRAGCDNDVYGHVNNVVYYSWFDTAVNAYLIEQGALDIHAGPGDRAGDRDTVQLLRTPGFSANRARRVCAWRIWARSSVRYEVGLFADDGGSGRSLRTFCACLRGPRDPPPRCRYLNR